MAEREKNAVTGSYPAGNGGRVEFPRRRSAEADGTMFYDTDPDFSIYSGMTRRNAIDSGTFTRGLKNSPPDLPKD